MRHFPLRELGYAIGFVVFLAAVYVGSYYALVDRMLFTWSNVDGSHETGKADAMYLFGGDLADDFFSPIHELDKKIRPDYWP